MSFRSFDRFELVWLPRNRIRPGCGAVLSITAAVAISAFLLACLGADVSASARVFLSRVLLSPGGWMETLVVWAPLGMASLGVTIARKAGFWNIGGEGQLLLGALAGFIAAGLVSRWASPVIPIVSIAAAFAGGAAVGAIAGMAKALRGTDEVIVTLLLNFVALYLVSYLLSGPLRDPGTHWVQTQPLAAAARFERIPGLGRVSGGVFVTITVSAVAVLLERRSPWNAVLEVIESNPRALVLSGIKSSTTIVVVSIVSGGLCGLAGWLEVAGTQYRLIEDLSPGYGYYAVVVAVASAGRCQRAVWISLILAMLLNGIDSSTRFANVPIYVGQIILGLAMICHIVIEKLGNHRARWRA